MISVIIPSYRNPKCLDICLTSLLKTQIHGNQIIVVLDGFADESDDIVDKYCEEVMFIPLESNMGMSYALNVGVYNSTNEWILIVNDDNVFPNDWDSILMDDASDKLVITPNQIERKPSIFNFIIDNFGGVDDFNLNKYLTNEPKYRKQILTNDGEIFPFFMQKKYYMVVGGFDTWYISPFICDWDFFMKLEMVGLNFVRTHKISFYHFGSMATKNGKESEMFTESEHTAADLFEYKWGFRATRDNNNSHLPNRGIIKGIRF